MNTALLGEVGEVIGGSTPKTGQSEFWDGDVQWATPAEISKLGSHYISTTARTLTKAGLAASGAKVLPPNSVLLSSRAPIGLVAINTVPMATNQGFKSIVPNRDVLDTRYLFWWLRSNTELLQSKGNGATFKEVSKAVVQSIEIPLPPLPEQRRIATILDQADALRAKRAEVVRRLNGQIDGVFAQMFGDPLRSSVRWPRERLADLGVVRTGNTPSRNRPSLFGGELEWIKSDNITAGLNLTPAKERLSEEGRKVARTAPPGSVLVTCIAGSPTSIGNAALTDREVAFNQQINAFIPKRLLPRFALAHFRIAPELVRRRSTGGMKGLVSKSQFESIEFVCPPMPDQERFVEIVSSIDRLKETAVQQTVSINTLFASLQHRAFRGEL